MDCLLEIEQWDYEVSSGTLCGCSQSWERQIQAEGDRTLAQNQHLAGDTDPNMEI
jgi:hypothetical protein